MKKIVCIITTLAFAFALTIGVKAWAIATFNAEGKEEVQTGNMTGSFTQYTQGLHKYSSGTITIQMKSYKPGLLGIGWTVIGNAKNCNYNGATGAIPEGRCNLSVSNSGTKNIKSTWQQITQGNMTADIGR